MEYSTIIDNLNIDLERNENGINNNLKNEKVIKIKNEISTENNSSNLI